jgi:hypothetical protein
MMLFDLESDPGEQRDVADEHPEIVQKLMASFESIRSEVPDFPEAPSAYLFETREGEPRTLMRLIGGELRYDRVPESQKQLIKENP